MEQPFVRIGQGPILTRRDLPFTANAVFNPGVAEMDGEVVLLLRIEDRQGLSHVRVARSSNGVDAWKIADEPILQPDQPDQPYEEWGCEDARVTQIGDREWLIAYCAFSRYGPAVALATTTDFVSAKRLGIVLPPTNKDATVFPEQVEGNWILLHRPVTGGGEHIWYARSETDFFHWCEHGILMSEGGGPWWDGLKIGCGVPPIKTEHGWLLIFHGVKDMAGNPIYRLGLALLDLEDPRKVLFRSSECVFSPETEYETSGLIPNVVYTCGALLRGDQVWMYYGAADTVIALAIANIKELLTFVEEYDFISRIGRRKGMVG